LAEEEEDRGDQCTGVTDTDPPNEVGDIPTPTNGTVNTPCTKTPINGPANREYTIAQQYESEEETYIPHAARLALDRANDVFRHLVVVLLSVN
jgi:hypothetical protein